MSKRDVAQPVSWGKNSAETATTSDGRPLPLVTVEALGPFVAQGQVIHKGQRVEQVPEHMARGLVARRKAVIVGGEA